MSANTFPPEVATGAADTPPSLSDQVSANLRLGTRDAYRSGTITLLAMTGLAPLVLDQLAVVIVVIVPTLLSE